MQKKKCAKPWRHQRMCLSAQYYCQLWFVREYSGWRWFLCHGSGIVIFPEGNENPWWVQSEVWGRNGHLGYIITPLQHWRQNLCISRGLLELGPLCLIKYIGLEAKPYVAGSHCRSWCKLCSRSKVVGNLFKGHTVHSLKIYNGE